MFRKIRDNGERSGKQTHERRINALEIHIQNMEQRWTYFTVEYLLHKHGPETGAITHDGRSDSGIERGEDDPEAYRDV
jgi:hypothetical protein